jgi:hypothetical protein
MNPKEAQYLAACTPEQKARWFAIYGTPEQRATFAPGNIYYGMKTPFDAEWGNGGITPAQQLANAKAQEAKQRGRAKMAENQADALHRENRQLKAQIQSRQGFGER